MITACIGQMIGAGITGFLGGLILMAILVEAAKN